MSKRNQPKIHSVGYNFIMNVVLKISAFIFPLISFPYVSRILGPDGNGKVEFATSLVYYFTVAASLGIPTYGIRVCAQCREDREKLTRTVHELLMICTVLCVTAYVALALTVLCVPKLRGDALLIAVSSSGLLLSTMGIEWFYQAIEEYGYITWRSIAFKLLSLVVMFLFVRDAEDFVIYSGVRVLGYSGSNVLNMVRLRKYISLRPMGGYNCRRHLKPAAMFFMQTVSATIYTHLDTVMLGFISGDREVGLYTVGMKMKTILTGLVTALGAVLMPRVSYYVENGMKKEFRESIVDSFRATFLMAIPLTVYCMLKASNIIGFLATEEYMNAVPAMVVISPTILFIGLSHVTGLQILVPLGMEKYTAISSALAAVTDIVLNARLIPSLGALGAAIGTLAAEILALVVQCFCLRKTGYLLVDGKDVIKVIAATAAAAAVLWTVNGVIRVQGDFLQLLITAVIFFGVYAVAVLLSKETLTGKILRGLLSRKHG